MSNRVHQEVIQSRLDDYSEDQPLPEELLGIALREIPALLTIRTHPQLVLWPDPVRTEESPSTPAHSVTPDLVLHFELSQNEEHARLRLEMGRQHIDLGERIHHYSLATLARLRMHDAQRGLDLHSQGWVATEDLARMLGVDSPYLNIQIFRARQQFSNALAPHSTRLPVERRRGEVRLSQCRFTVRRGALLEGGSLR